MTRWLLLILLSTKPIFGFADMVCPPVAQAQAQAVLARVRSALPATKFASAAPAPAGTCWVQLTLADGAKAWASPDGRYFFYGAMFDLSRGGDAGRATAGE